jgi:hypothetical protein
MKIHGVLRNEAVRQHYASVFVTPFAHAHVYTPLMVQAYNFLASWQLFPEKCAYESGDRPLSGICRFRSAEDARELHLEVSWVDIRHQGFDSGMRLVPDGRLHPIEEHDLADASLCCFIDGITFEHRLFRSGEQVLHAMYEIQPNGYLRVTQKGLRENGTAYTNTEYYHKQLSVLPYSASVAGAVIKPTESGVIRHKSLTAMEEQTNMQLEQIRRQIELLALQAQEIHRRKELSQIIYGAQLNFSPVIGQIYHLYERRDGTHLLSMVSPTEWGAGGGPFRKCLATVKLLADHTWMEVV